MSQMTVAPGQVPESVQANINSTIQSTAIQQTAIPVVSAADTIQIQNEYSKLIIPQYKKRQYLIPLQRLSHRFSIEAPLTEGALF